MSTIFNVSDEEAKKIRLLHEEESKNKKISSSLREQSDLSDFFNSSVVGSIGTNQAPVGLCGGPHPGTGGPVGGEVHWTGNCPGSPNLLNPFPCARIDGQTPNSSHIGWQINMQGGALGFCATVSSVGPFNGNSTSATPTQLQRSNSCTDCDTPYNSGGSDSWDCDGQGNCTQVQGTGGQYASQSQCLQNCQPPERWRCTSGYQCIQDPNGPYLTQQDCQQNCVEPDYSYNCNIAMGQCHQVAGGGGQFLTLTDCQQNCEYNGKWTCKKYNTHHGDKHEPDRPMELGESHHVIGMPSTGWHCVKDPNGIHNTQAACQALCPPRDEKIDCINCEEGVMTQVTAPDPCPRGFAPITDLTHGPCVQCDSNICTPCGWCYGSSPMTFNSMVECQNSPQCQSGGYTCVGTGPNAQCQADPNSTQTLQQCQQNCPPQQGQTWDCNGTPAMNGSCDPVQGSGGAFQTEDDCLTSPCSCDSIILAWPFYQNNPNNPQGNWYGTPHDGPSNPNALSQILSNVQNSNAYTSTNPVQLHKAKCREAAILHWQGSGANVACCQDQNFAVGYATSDPLGCVNQNFIDLINQNFILNSPNWPGQGCNWLQNALTTTTTNQAQYPPTSGAYCKLQGKIDFIQNLMQTGQSTYVLGSVSFTPPC